MVTDRLHAGVLAMLMGKPAVLVDNANKKISRIHHDYFGAVPGTHLAKDFDEAARIAREVMPG